MGYQSIKNYFVRMMSTYGFFEAKKKLDFTNEGENLDNLFIVENPKTNLDEGDTLTTNFFPKRTFTIKVARKFSESSMQYDYDALLSKLDTIVTALHDPDNYRTDGIKRIMWDSTEIGVEKGYFTAVMSFIAEDKLTYA